eukprot:6172275-Pleurochrysis_carterae.AAC.2
MSATTFHEQHASQSVSPYAQIARPRWSAAEPNVRPSQAYSAAGITPIDNTYLPWPLQAKWGKTRSLSPQESMRPPRMQHELVNVSYFASLLLWRRRWLHMYWHALQWCHLNRSETSASQPWFEFAALHLHVIDKPHRAPAFAARCRSCCRSTACTRDGRYHTPSATLRASARRGHRPSIALARCAARTRKQVAIAGAGVHG